MDKDSLIELVELNSNLYSPISNSKENLIEVSLNLYKHMYSFLYKTKTTIL